ncbi:hypothetical protein [Andreprevotia sp. IGB-42]|uniref:hypothetical protein n=1 Tax=Andreprevotia sp. IGB-42 TaxID=2497473 RepID=UPI00135C6581|nr:hypothetical protein [Andreprevotia sp. IGB-42]
MRGHDAGEWYTAPDALASWADFWQRAIRRLALPNVDLVPFRQLSEAFRDDADISLSLLDACQASQDTLRAIYRRCNVYQIREVAKDEQTAILLGIQQ